LIITDSAQQHEVQMNGNMQSNYNTKIQPGLDVGVRGLLYRFHVMFKMTWDMKKKKSFIFEFINLVSFKWPNRVALTEGI
jgi:hypothetical protein